MFPSMLPLILYTKDLFYTSYVVGISKGGEYQPMSFKACDLSLGHSIHSACLYMADTHNPILGHVSYFGLSCTTLENVTSSSILIGACILLFYFCTLQYIFIIVIHE